MSRKYINESIVPGAYVQVESWIANPAGGVWFISTNCNLLGNTDISLADLRGLVVSVKDERMRMGGEDIVLRRAYVVLPFLHGATPIDSMDLSVAEQPPKEDLQF